MSRIGRKVIHLPEGVSAAVDGAEVIVKGPKGELSYVAHRDIAVALEDNQLVCSPVRQSKRTAALWGTTRARLANMVKGVQEGFRKELELHGVGYRASLKGKDLELLVGYSHPVVVSAPDGISFGVEQELVTIEGIDTVLVGQVAADIRAIRKPEPYKGKGIRYRDEHVRRKVGKIVGATE